MIGPGSGARPQSSPVRSGNRRIVTAEHLVAKTDDPCRPVLARGRGYTRPSSCVVQLTHPMLLWWRCRTTAHLALWGVVRGRQNRHGAGTCRPRLRPGIRPHLHPSSWQENQTHTDGAFKRRPSCTGSRPPNGDSLRRPRKQDHDARRSRRARGGYRGRQGLGDGEPVPEYEARGAHRLAIGHMHGGRTHRERAVAGPFADTEAVMGRLGDLLAVIDFHSETLDAW